MMRLRRFLKSKVKRNGLIVETLHVDCDELLVSFTSAAQCSEVKAAAKCL